MAEGTQDALAFGPDVRIGFLGGGQLGRMTIQAALDLDMRIEVLDPIRNAPAPALPINSHKETSTMPKRSSHGAGASMWSPWKLRT